MEKAMAPHSSTLAWKIPWMEEPGWLQTQLSDFILEGKPLIFHFVPKAWGLAQSAE